MKKVKDELRGADTATDVLETSEVLRSANCMCRMASGILGFANQICKAEVLSESKMKEINDSLDVVLNAFKDVYAALLARYSALSASDGLERSSN